MVCSLLCFILKRKERNFKHNNKPRIFLHLYLKFKIAPKQEKRNIPMRVLASGFHYLVIDFVLTNSALSK